METRGFIAPNISNHNKFDINEVSDNVKSIQVALYKLFLFCCNITIIDFSNPWKQNDSSVAKNSMYEQLVNTEKCYAHVDLFHNITGFVQVNILPCVSKTSWLQCI
jgi:hypothetical protein